MFRVMSEMPPGGGDSRLCWKALRRVAILAILFSTSTLARAAEAPAWSEKDTRLATEYLNLLVEKPEYGRVLELLWDLYDKNRSTGMLLDSIAAQAKSQTHPNVLLVHAHLLRKAGKNAEAQTVYQAVLEKDRGSAIALRALADLSLEKGDKDKALSFLDDLINTFPADDSARTPLLVEKGRVASEINKPNIAAAAWTEALKLQKHDGAFTRQVAQLMVGAGLLDQALAIYRDLVKNSDPVEKLNSLYDLSRLEEQADHFDNAAKALRDGLSLTHFKDWHYEEFFRRLVKLHERYGQLDTLKAQLLKAARAEPPQERALLDMARFADMVVDPDEQVHWLRILAKNFPAQIEHRWSLVRVLLDHDGQAEAATLLDEILKSDATDSASLVLLRCEVYLRAG
jgi:tetratricopeptide (TPR) repeat protein